LRRKSTNRYRNKKQIILTALLLVILLFLAAAGEKIFEKNQNSPISISNISEEIPVYDGTPCIEINENRPMFTEYEITSESFEHYSELDIYGRAGVATACISKDLMPESDREDISEVRPSGWQSVKYPNLIEDEYLYNRCHLIAYMLTAENGNEKNLITGTRYFNIEGMLPYEMKVAEYIWKTKNHVMYRVTPVYSGNDLVCKGVLMEAYSVEDKGRGVQFCVFAYNVQPGIEIDYSNGDSWVK